MFLIYIFYIFFYITELFNSTRSKVKLLKKVCSRKKINFLFQFLAKYYKNYKYYKYYKICIINKLILPLKSINFTYPRYIIYKIP